MKYTHDVIIVGGGMVGASLARALSGAGLDVGVVESWSPDAQAPPSYDDRAIALAYGTRAILQGIGVWSELAEEAEPIRRIHVSDRGHFGFARLDHRDLEVEALGYVVTGRVLGRLLLQGLERCRATTLYCPAVLSAFTVDEAGVQVWIEQQGASHRLTGKLLVAADGTHSTVREQLGIEVSRWDYGQHAVISNVTPGTEPCGVAYERFTDTGPLAMLPLTEGRYGLVWTVEASQLETVMAWDEQEFLRQLQVRFGNRLGGFQRAGRRASYPLALVRAREHVRPRVALIGNAAHSVHPITGQGFNLGMRDVAVLAEVLQQARQQRLNIGDLAVLERYAEWRRRDQQAVALMTDGLVRLFTNPLLPVRALRDLGMLALDLAPPLKNLLTRQFMGLNGRLPGLARGSGFER
ncbi:MAG: 2-octaprenyl-6-methoxyphenyl hydroxylase [Gammaproteobacteria bacterium]|nr:2-octaprenyl-6-methoxyphenyl hydroxylase [Gammaproteobacteria bacterium]